MQKVLSPRRRLPAPSSDAWAKPKRPDDGAGKRRLGDKTFCIGGVERYAAGGRVGAGKRLAARAPGGEDEARAVGPVAKRAECPADRPVGERVDDALHGEGLLEAFDGPQPALRSDEEAD